MAATSEMHTTAYGRSDELELREESPAPVPKLESYENISGGMSEPSREAGNNTSEASENDNEQQSDDTDGEATSVEPESTVTIAAWNIHGLASYKHNSLLNYAAVLQLDVFVLCETHLTNADQMMC